MALGIFPFSGILVLHIWDIAICFSMADVTNNFKTKWPEVT